MQLDKKLNFEYDKAFNESFHAKLESLQYNATLAITGAIRGSSTEKIYEELRLEFSKVNNRRTFLILYQKAMSNEKFRKNSLFHC